MLFSTTQSKPILAKTLIVSAIAVLAWAYVSSSQGQGLASAQEIAKLIETQQFSRAQTRVNESLKVAPNDPELQFLAALVAQSQGKTAEAIAIYNKLTKDYPNLPEAYNNLAVIYAAQGDLDGARSMLEKAITTHPSYSTAHNNLGGVYAKLSSRAYSKALQVNDPSAASNAAKLEPITTVASLDTTKAQSGKSSTSTWANNTSVKPTAPAVKPNGDNTPSNTVAKPVNPIAVSTPTTPSKPAAAVETKPVNPAKVETEKDKQAAEVDAVKKAVNAWASAWAGQNMDAYLGAYHKSFVPPSGLSRSEWEKQRRERIVGRDTIKVKVSDINVTVNGDKATARFHQDYASGSIKSSGSKTLQLQKNGSRWQIVTERT